MFSDLYLYFRNLEKDEQMKSQVSREKKKSRAKKIKEIENK